MLPADARRRHRRPEWYGWYCECDWIRRHSRRAGRDRPTGLAFLTGKLFANLFVDPRGPTDRSHAGGYKYSAHVRQIATGDRVNSESEEDEAFFSIVVSRRCGPINVSELSMLIMHLLSLCWDPRMPFPDPTDRVAVTTLYSWTYTWLASRNDGGTSETSVNVGNHLTVLRTDAEQESLEPLQDKDSTLQTTAPFARSLPSASEMGTQ